MNEIDELIEFIKNDIESINKGLTEDISPLFRYMGQLQNKKCIFFIEEDFFKNLVNKYCFYCGIAFSQVNIPDDRFALFKKLFASKVRIKPFRYKNQEILIPGYFQVRYAYGETLLDSLEHLYLNLFKAIYTESLNNLLTIENIFAKFLKQWKFFLKNQRIPVQIITFFPDISLDQGTISISNTLELRDILAFIIFGGPEFKSMNFFPSEGSFLFTSTELLCNHNFLDKTDIIDRKELNEEWYEKIKLSQEIILCLFLEGIRFTDESTDILLPWWFKDRALKFKEDFRLIAGGTKTITNEILAEVENTYNMVNKLKIFDDKELELALHRYYHLLKKDFLIDMILDEFIILESIFTRGSPSEVGFRLSSNLAYFISQNIEEFKKIYRSINTFYTIRSKIAHGEDWLVHLAKEKHRKEYRKCLDIEDPNMPKEKIAREIYLKLREYIEISLKKIIGLKYEKLVNGESPKIMKTFRGTYFIENSYLLRKL